MFAGIFLRVRRGLLCAGIALLASFAASESAVAQDGSTASCPLVYEHADPRREDGSGVAQRLASGQRLGSLAPRQVGAEQALPITWQRCISAGLPEAPEESQEDAAACIVPIALSFADELKNLSPTVPVADRGIEALTRFKQKWRAIDRAIADDPLAVCGIGMSTVSRRVTAAKFLVEVLNVMAVRDAEPALQRGYLRAFDLDAQNDDSASCTYGCARLYWIRRLLEKR